MRNPVNQLFFWKDRLEDAKKRNIIHYSVFLANQPLWDSINTKHQKIIDQEVKPTDRVLDAGCGYGRTSEMIKSKDYVGVDFSPDFIEEAKTRYPDREFMVGDLKSLPFKDKEFDVSIAISIKHMIQDNLGDPAWKEMEQELKRVSKKVLILEYGLGDLGIENNANDYEILQ